MSLSEVKSPEQNDPRGRFVVTASGAKFFINEQNVTDIPIRDVAHAISMNVRFNGHINKFYSVGEHCLNVSRLVPEKYALWGLVHDVTEAFVPDIPRPFKSLLNGFKEYEDKIGKAYADALELEWPMPKEVHEVDKHIVAVEAQQLFDVPPEWTKAYDTEWIDSLARENAWPLYEYLGGKPEEIEEEWIERFNELTSKKIRDKFPT